MRRAARTLLLCLACLCLGPLPGTAGAAPSVESSALSPSDTQAGAHADLDVWVSLKDPGEPEAAKDLLIGLPPGYFLYPSLQVRCTTAQFGEGNCPVDSQVGVVAVRGHYEGNPEFELGTAPVHLLAPEDGGTRLGFVVPTAEVPVEAPVTASLDDEYGLELALRNLPQTTPLRSLALTLWGVPADPIHDAEREGPASAPAAPFTRNPTSCGPGGSLSVEVDSYQDPGDFATASASTSSIVGCGKLAFDPALEFGLTSSQASAEAGLKLAVEIPADASPGGLSSSDAAEILLELPPELELDEEGLPPPPAPLGSFTATVLGLEAPFAGTALYLGPMFPGAYRLALVGTANGIPLALQVLIAYDGAAEAWALRLLNLPQLPLTELKLQIGNAGGPFVAPPECGTFEAASKLNAWSGSPPLLAAHELTIDSGPGGEACPSPAPPTPPTPPVVVPPPPSSPPPPAAAATPPPPKPIVRLRRWPPPRTRDRTPTFGFVSNVAGSTFECRLDNRPLPRCKSPLTLPHLGLGRHVFKVRTVTPGGARSFFAIYGFTVRR